MTGEDAVAVMVDLMERVGIDYMLVGSFSSNHYGISRATKDADFVIHAPSEKTGELAQILPDGFDLDAQMSFEMVTAITKQVVFVREIPFEIELFDLSSDPFDQQRFSRRTRVWDRDIEMILPTAEDVIVQKLRWSKGGARQKDYDDARDVTAVQGRNLDFNYIRSWADKHGTRAVFEEIYSSVERFF